MQQFKDFAFSQRSRLSNQPHQNEVSLYNQKISDMLTSKFDSPSPYLQEPELGSSDPMEEGSVPGSPFSVPKTTKSLNGDIYIDRQKVDGKWYNPYTKKFGNKAFRNNNQGNITGAGGKLLYGAAKISRSPLNSDGDRGDAKQLVFNTPRDGWRAMYSLMRSPRYNGASISKAFEKYQSDKNAWKNMQTKLTKSGINVNSAFNSLPMSQQIEFMNQRAGHEGWTGSPLTLADLS